jgi:hypothetical protein
MRISGEVPGDWKRPILCDSFIPMGPETQHLLLLAYLDPGTGSFILQAVIGVVLGAVLTLKMYWRRVRDFASGLLRKNRDES